MVGRKFSYPSVQKKNQVKNKMRMGHGEKLILSEVRRADFETLAWKDPVTHRPMNLVNASVEGKHAEIIGLNSLITREGLAKDLIHKMCKRLEARGVEHIELWVSADEASKPAALKIYESAGFKRNKNDPLRMYKDF